MLKNYFKRIFHCRWLGRYGRDMSLAEHPFYRLVLEAGDGSNMAVFLSECIKQFAFRRNALSYNMDATFKVVPRNGLGTQLFIVHLNAYHTVKKMRFKSFYFILNLIIFKLRPAIKRRNMTKTFKYVLKLFFF